MKSLILSGALLGTLAAVPRTAASQQPVVALSPTDTVTLTLGEAVSRAKEQSEEVRLAESQLDLAAAQVTSARSAALPQIDATLNYTRTFASPFNTGSSVAVPDSLRFEPDSTLSIAERVSYLEENVPNAGLAGLGGLFGNLPFGRENAYTAALTGTQLIYSGGRVSAALKIAGSFREAAEFNYQEQVAEVELQVRTQYYRAALAQEFESIAREALEQAERFLAEEQLRETAGTAAELDVLRADVTAENLRPQLVEATNAAALAMLDLKRLVNIPLSQPVRLSTPLTPPGPDVLAAEVAEPSPQLAIAQRAAIAAAERQVAIKEQQVAVARGAYLPNVSLRVNYGGQMYPNSPFGFSGTDWRKDVSAVVGISVPVFSGFRIKAEVSQARVELEQSRLQLAQLKESVQLQYEQARGERAQALASIAARQRTVDQAQRVHDLTVLRYERGLATQLDVSEARLALLQARTNLAQATADYYIADAALARALGLPDSGAPSSMNR